VGGVGFAAVTCPDSISCLRLEIGLEHPARYGENRSCEQQSEHAARIDSSRPVHARAAVDGREGVTGRPSTAHEALTWRSATDRIGSISVTSNTLSMVLMPPNPFTTVRRRLPIRGGPSDRSSARIECSDHSGDPVGSVRTAKTSSSGR